MCKKVYPRVLTKEERLKKYEKRLKKYKYKGNTLINSQ